MKDYYEFDKKQIGDYSVMVISDDNPINPRKNDYEENVAKLCCAYNGYDLGDSDACEELDALLEKYFDYDEEWEFWDDAEKMDKLSEIDDIVILPLSVYEHGGITMRCGTKDVFCGSKWDATNVGFAYITKETAEREGVLDGGPAYATWEDWAVSMIKDEVEIYDSYLTGAVFAVVVTDKDDKKVFYSSGYYNEEDAMEIGIEEAKKLEKEGEHEKEKNKQVLSNINDEMGGGECFISALCESLTNRQIRSLIDTLSAMKVAK